MEKIQLRLFGALDGISGHDVREIESGENSWTVDRFLGDRFWLAGLLSVPCMGHLQLDGLWPDQSHTL